MCTSVKWFFCFFLNDMKRFAGLDAASRDPWHHQASSALLKN